MAEPTTRRPPTKVYTVHVTQVYQMWADDIDSAIRYAHGMDWSDHAPMEETIDVEEAT